MTFQKRGRAVACLAGSLLALGGLPAPASGGPVDTPGVPYTSGANRFGQLGDGTTTARLTHDAVSGLSGVVDIHGGREHVIALTDGGSVYTWGSNVQGQLGIGTTGNRSLPVQVPGLVDNVLAVETGHYHSVVLRSDGTGDGDPTDGTVWTWGLNKDGQLGDGTTTTRRSPLQVARVANVVAIAAGRDMTYALLANGSVKSWGRNDWGQVGDGTTTRRLRPVVVSGLTNVVDVGAGRDHGLALRGDGTVWAWGYNAYGQLGDGTTTNRTVPRQVATGIRTPNGPEDQGLVIAGADHSYALRTDGQVFAWGRNYRGALGDGTTTRRLQPVLVKGLQGAVTLGAGRDHGMATLADGSVMTWGYNAFGQLGDGTTTNRNVPVPLSGITNAVLAGGGGAEYSVVLVGPTG